MTSTASARISQAARRGAMPSSRITPSTMADDGQRDAARSPATAGPRRAHRPPRRGGAAPGRRRRRSRAARAPKRTSATPIAGRSSNGLRALTRAAPGAHPDRRSPGAGEAQAVERLAEGRLGLGERPPPWPCRRWRSRGRRARRTPAAARAASSRRRWKRTDAHERALAVQRPPSRSRAARRRRPGRACRFAWPSAKPARPMPLAQRLARDHEIGNRPVGRRGRDDRDGGAVGPARRERQLVGVRAHGGHGLASAQTSSMYAISAASPRRGPSLMMRV